MVHNVMTVECLDLKPNWRSEVHAISQEQHYQKAYTKRAESNAPKIVAISDIDVVLFSNWNNWTGTKSRRTLPCTIMQVNRKAIKLARSEPAWRQWSVERPHPPSLLCKWSPPIAVLYQVQLMCPVYKYYYYYYYYYYSVVWCGVGLGMHVRVLRRLYIYRIVRVDHADRVIDTVRL